MDPQELFRSIRRIEIYSRRLVHDLFAGGYHSVFKGRGIEFSEVREYVPGDDVRLIDWNATARFGRPYVKLFSEERQLTVMLLVDVSGSMDFGTRARLKRQLATEFCATIAFSAISNNDQVGLILFTDRVERIIPPKKGRRHILRLIHELLQAHPGRRGTNVALALDTACRLMSRAGTIFLVSDLLADDFERSLLLAAKRHDTIAVTIRDRCEAAGDLTEAAESLPEEGLYAFQDPETGEVAVVDLGHQPTREALVEARRRLDAGRSRLLTRSEVEEIRLVTDKSFVEPLTTFFRRRARHLRQGV